MELFRLNFANFYILTMRLITRSLVHILCCVVDSQDLNDFQFDNRTIKHLGAIMIRLGHANLLGFASVI